MMLRIRNPQDFCAGILFVAIGLAGIVFARDLAVGTADRMGPGYFPMLLCILMIVIGGVVSFRGLSVEGPSIEGVRIRPLVTVSAAILAFIFLIDQLGLVVTTVIFSTMVSFASTGMKWIEIAVLNVALVIFGVVIFVYAIGTPIPIWWS